MRETMTPWGPIGKPSIRRQEKIDRETRFTEAHAKAAAISGALAAQKVLGEYRIMTPELEQALEGWQEEHAETLREAQHTMGGIVYADYSGQYPLTEKEIQIAEECTQAGLDLIPKSPGE